jgi:hypothetical protein
LLLYQTAKHSKLGRRQVLLIGLGVDEQHVENRLLRMPEVDDSNSTSLPLPFNPPTHLSKATCPRNESALFGSQDKGQLKCTVPFVVEK